MVLSVDINFGLAIVAPMSSIVEVNIFGAEKVPQILLPPLSSLLGLNLHIWARGGARHWRPVQSTYCILKSI